MPMPARYNSDELLDAALGLFAEGGLEAVTMAGVARAVGAPSGSLYHRFTGRPALVASLWLRAVERFQHGYLTALEVKSPRTAVHQAVAHVLGWARTHPAEARLLLDHGPDDVIGPDTPDEIRKRQQVGQRRLDQALVELQHRLPKGVSRARLRFALVDLPYAAVRPYLHQQRPPPDEVDEFVAQALDALLPQGEAPQKA